MRKYWKRIGMLLIAYLVLAGHSSCEDIKTRPGQEKIEEGTLDSEKIPADAQKPFQSYKEKERGQ
ncbi:hypothetical protein LIT25_26695 (plasmid) [Bacillus sp. F19]|nr:hypothetical protein LIT25_26695 [Bacillus sp. F19]